MDMLNWYVPYRGDVSGNSVHLRRKGIVMWSGDHEAVNCVLDGDLDRLKNLDVNGVYEPCGLALMHIAAHCGHIEIMKYLASKGQSLNTLSGDGLPPLHYASESNKDEAVSWLASMM